MARKRRMSGLTDDVLFEIVRVERVRCRDEKGLSFSAREACADGAAIIVDFADDTSQSGLLTARKQALKLCTTSKERKAADSPEWCRKAVLRVFRALRKRSPTLDGRKRRR